MRQLWMALAVGGLTVGAMACGDPTPTPVDSGQPGGGGGGGGGGDGGTDGGTDGGNLASTSTFASDAGLTFTATGGRFLENDDGIVFAMTTQASGDQDLCSGSLPQSPSVWGFAAGNAPGTFLVENQVAFVSFDRADDTYVDATTGTVTFSAVSATRLAGSLDATTLIDETDTVVPGGFEATFDLARCPIYTGTGANAATGERAFPISGAFYRVEGVDLEVYLPEADIQVAICTDVDPTVSTRYIGLQFTPPDLANPEGTYTDADGALVIVATSHPDGSHSGLNISDTATIEVTGSTGTELTGTFQAEVVARDLGAVTTLSGTFKAPIACQ